MRERDLEPEFSSAALAQAQSSKAASDATAVDLRPLPWCSIDNDDSRDLDQLTVAEILPGGVTRLQVAVADVDAVVAKGSPADLHAMRNTTSIYTSGGVFPMLPERLSTDVTSLNPDQERIALVVRIDLDGSGKLVDSGIVRARVRSQAKLAYPSVSTWLDGGQAPPGLSADGPVAATIRLQDHIAEGLGELRQQLGALDLDTGETHAVIRDGRVVDMRMDVQTRANRLIAEAMIAANGVVARFLAASGVASIRRVVRQPKRWDRIVELAKSFGTRLPTEPDAIALETFLRERRRLDPARFTDLSLSVVKLIGRGEYVLERPGQGTGHFGLAVRAYTHSTAPNRRYPDLIAHRQVKAVLAGLPQPYDDRALADLAAHCTDQEDNATKVERQMRKSAAALLLQPRLGETFDAVVTGASDKGIWVRILRPPVEGKLIRSTPGLDVGDRLRVKLVSADVERGFIDFLQ